MKEGLKGQCHEIFDFWFFHESVSPKPLSIQTGRFEFFRKSAEIFAVQSAPPVSLTPVANLPPVSLIPAAISNRRRFTPAANLPPLSFILVANLPPVLSIRAPISL